MAGIKLELAIVNSEGPCSNRHACSCYAFVQEGPWDASCALDLWLQEKTRRLNRTERRNSPTSTDRDDSDSTTPSSFLWKGGKSG